MGWSAVRARCGGRRGKVSKRPIAILSEVAMILLLTGGLCVVLLREAVCGQRCAAGPPLWLIVTAALLLAPGSLAALAAWLPLLGEAYATRRWAWLVGLALWLPCVVVAVVGGTQVDAAALPPTDGAATLSALRRWAWAGLALAPLGSLCYSRLVLRRTRLSAISPAPAK
jgi:hypothetical protein